jgi:hypothetical protein
MERKSICPSCGDSVDVYRCGTCGTTKSTNPISGNIVWMKNEKIVAAFKDAKSAHLKTTKKFKK